MVQNVGNDILLMYGIFNKIHRSICSIECSRRSNFKVLFSSINSAITCESLGSFANGAIAYRTDRTSPFDFGTTATYSCNRGYYLEGEDVRTCVEDESGLNGIWSGLTPRCAGR